MDKEVSLAKMQEYIKPALNSGMSREYSWEFEIEDLVIYIKLSPRNKPSTKYLLRVEFHDFPKKAPSYVFVDINSKKMTREAWPPNVKHGSSPSICTPGTREFHERLHNNDARYPWSMENYSFLEVLQNIQVMMEKGVEENQ